MNHNCHVVPVEKIVTPEEQDNTEHLILVVQGMGCSNCAMRVRNRLFALKGVVSAEVSHLTALANITFNPDLVTQNNLSEAVANAGNDGRHSYQVISILASQPVALLLGTRMSSST
jgi:copper chaperone CopZ